jgi:hypothetical protein
MQDDRPNGAILAGKVTILPSTPDNQSFLHWQGIFIADNWMNGTVENINRSRYVPLGQQAHGLMWACAIIPCVHPSVSVKLPLKTGSIGRNGCH